METAEFLASTSSAASIDPEVVKELVNANQVELQAKLQALSDQHNKSKAVVAETSKKHYRQLASVSDSIRDLKALSSSLDRHLFHHQGSQSGLASKENPNFSSGSATNAGSSPSATQILSNLYLNVEIIEDILRAPQLTRDCAASGSHNSALELYNYLKRLNGRFPNNETVTDTFKAVEAEIQTMTTSLIRTLRESNRLSHLIKIVAFLKRVPAFKSSPTANSELQILFLSSRLAYLNIQAQALTVLRNTSPAPYLKKLLELYREVTFSIVTSFKTIFGGESKYLSQFIRLIVDKLNSEMSNEIKHVPHDDDKSALWLQLAWCSKSLARVGAEFWPLKPNEALSTETWGTTYSNQAKLSKSAMLKASVQTAAK